MKEVKKLYIIQKKIKIVFSYHLQQLRFIKTLLKSMKSKTVKKKLIILGGDGVGEIAANIALENNICSEIFFLNDSQKKYIGRFKRKFKVIGKLSKIKDLFRNDEFIFFNAIINYKKKLDRSLYLIKEAKKKQISLIHPSVKFFKDRILNETFIYNMGKYSIYEKILFFFLKLSFKYKLRFIKLIYLKLI